MDYIAYDFYNKFKCEIGCIDTCCKAATWAIAIDKDSIKRYNELEGEFGEKVRAGIDENGKFKFHENGHCVMFNEDGLCDIHKNLGSEYLCNTCKNFPRSSYAYNGIVHYSLSCACPVVAKEILFDREGVFFNSGKLEKEIKIEPPHEKERISYKLRGLTADILQDPSAKLDDKLIYASMLYESIGKAPSYGPKAQKEQMKIIEIYTSKISEIQAIAKTHKERDGKTVIEKIGTYKFFISLLQGFLVHENAEQKNKDFYERLDRLLDNKLEGLELDNLKDNFNAYFINNEIVFENFIITSIFEKVFPANENGIRQAFTIILLQYVMVQMLISLLYYDKNEINDDDVCNCLYYVTRKFSHNGSFIDNMNKVIEQNEVLSNIEALLSIV